MRWHSRIALISQARYQGAERDRSLLSPHVIEVRSHLSNSGRGEAFGSASSNGDQHPHTNASPSPDYPVEAEDLGGLKNLRGLVLWTATLPNHADRSHQNPHDFMGIERDD